MSLPRIFEELRPSIVAFVSRLVPGQPGQEPPFPSIFGTGFVVDSRGIVATNDHVVEEVDRLRSMVVGDTPVVAALLFTQIETSGNTSTIGCALANVKRSHRLDWFQSSGTWYGRNRPDLAFVQLEVRDLPAVSLNATTGVVKTGIEVASAGFPLGETPLAIFGHLNQVTPLLRRGIVSSVYPFAVPRPHGFTLDMLQQPGCSGSPVFLEDTGEVVGVIHAKVPDSNITIALPSWLVAKALSSLLEREPPDLTGIPTLDEWIEGSDTGESELSWSVVEPADVGDGRRTEVDSE